MKLASHSSQSGLSLVELMIAMLLGLLLIGGVLQVFLSSKQTFSSNTALSRVQENGRFAMTFLTYDLRNAGYKGECVSELNNLTGLTDARYTLDMALQGWESGQSIPNWFSGTRRSGTDAILVKHAAAASGATPSAASSTDSISTTAATGIAQGTLLVLSDPIGCDLFRNNSAASNSAVSVNGASFGHIYPSTSDILKFESTLYFVNNNSAGSPSLYRIRYNSGASAEEVAEGIQDLQIKYAVGNVNGAVSGDYVDASSISDWSTVVSAQITLTAVSTDNANPMTRTFTSTIGLRNRLP
ncbi:PilW family protein [Pseudomonas sp. NY15181]|uniref:PilW family protein n=1 Tax=Pseudomonas sp. NY15181 TaxID=3400349 RepID=UPI003A85F401